MSLSYSEELLSAYLDGELTPEESNYVQLLLEEKPEIKERLSELRIISQRVKLLPRESAPQNFTESVLNNLDSQAALPKVVSGSPRKKSYLKIWSSTLAAIAGIFIIGLLLIQNHHETASTVSLVEDANSISASESQFTEGEDEIEEVALIKQDYSIAGTHSGSNATGSLELSDSNTLGLSLPKPASANIGGGIPDFNTTSLPKIISLDRATIQRHLNSLGESPGVGDEFSILTSKDDAPILVDFTVVDVNKALGNLQVLLKNHSVDQIAFDDQGSEKHFGANDKLVAVYLKLEQSDLENVLNQVAAVDATLIVEESHHFSEGSFSVDGLEDRSADEPRPAFSSSTEDPENVQDRIRIKDQPYIDSSASQSVEEVEAEPYQHGQTQKFNFDLAAARFSNSAANDASKLSYENPESKGTQLENGINFMEERLPPSPSLPELIAIDESNNSAGEPAESKPSAESMISAPPVSDNLDDSTSMQTEQPGKNHNKQKRQVKAILILREGKGPKISQ